jgi:hypothetical protein
MQDHQHGTSKAGMVALELLAAVLTLGGATNSLFR